MTSKNQPEDYSALIRDIKDNIKTRLRDLMSKLLNNSEHTLFNMADSAASNKDQMRHFELMRLLKENKPDIAANYISSIEPLLRPYPITEAEKTRHKIKTEDELSLVDHAVIEDMVLIKNVGERAAGKYREQLSHLEARLEHLALKTDDIFQKHALAPVNLCQAFDDALGDNFDIPHKKVLFSFFYDEVASKLDSLYDSINNKLIDAGVLPQIKLSMMAKAQNRSRLHTQIDPDQAMQEDQQGDTANGNYQPSAGGYAQSGGGYRTAGGTGSPGGASPGGAGTGSPGGASPGGAGTGGPGGASPGGAGTGGPGGAGPGGAGTGGPGGTSPGGAGTGGAGGVPGSTGAVGSPQGMPGQTGDNVWPGGGAMPSAGTSGSVDLAADNASQQPQNIGGGYAMTAAPGQNYSRGAGSPGQHSDPNQDSAQSAPPGQPASGSSGAGGGPQTAGADSASTETPPGTGVYSHTVAGMPAEQVSQTIGKYLGAPIHRAGAGTGAENLSFPISTPQDFGHEEILSALSGVQSLPQFHQPSELRFDADAIKSAVVSEIARKSGGVVTKRINQIAAKTIDFIELIFDAIIDDEDISDTIKALLLRLQIPIIKASMLDPEFFIYDTHPARVLLDTIAEVGFGVTDHEDATYVELEKVISIILNEYELQTSTFQRALDRLNQYIEEQEARAREKEAAVQKQVLREHARNTVLKALRTITAGKTLPEGIHPLVLKRWPTLMYNHYLENGKDNEEWHTIIEALREIVASVQPLNTADDLAYLQLNRDTLLQHARDFLQTTNQSSYDIDSVLQGLESTHHKLITRTNFNIEEIEAANARIIAEEERAREDEEYAEYRGTAHQPAETQPAPKPKLPHNIMPGMWFHIFIGDDKAARRAKLSVIIVEDSNLVFVNHNGDIIVEKEFSEFNKEIEEGKSKVIMGHSVFDHALSSVISQLHPR